MTLQPYEVWLQKYHPNFNIFNIHCNLDHSSPIFLLDTLAWFTMKLSLIAKESLVQKTQQKELYINYTSCMTLMLKIANHFFCMTLWPCWCTTTSSLVTKDWMVQKIFSGHMDMAILIHIFFSSLSVRWVGLGGGGIHTSNPSARGPPKCVFWWGWHACMHMSVSDSVSVRVLCFSAVSVSLCFVWLSTCSNVL